MDCPIDQFWSNGFAFMRSVFAVEEVARWRAAALKMPPFCDLFSDDELRGFALDPRILARAREILGSDQLVYFGDSNVLNGPTHAGFHKDNADKTDPRAPDWTGRYPIIRFGLYAQDHAKNPDGLDLRRGSLEVCSVSEGEHVYADLSIGDLAVWNLRTTHSGGSVMLRNGTPLDPSGYPARLLRRYPFGLLRRPAYRRVGIFCSFGLHGPPLDRYIAYLKTRDYAVRRWRESPFTERALADARAAGVQVIDLPTDIRIHPPTVTNADHVALPY